MRRPSGWATIAVLAAGLWLPGWGCSASKGGGARPDAAAEVATPTPVPAGLSVCFSDRPASCSQTCRGATRVLWENCASCHDDSGAASGSPPWDFVMIPQRLVTESLPREGQAPQRFVVPGHADDSLIYQRAVTQQNMPPVQMDFNQPFYPRVTAADGRILRTWITDCLREAVVDAGSDAGAATGAADAIGALDTAGATDARDAGPRG